MQTSLPTSQRRRSVLTMLAAIGLGSVQTASAQAYPSRPFCIVVPFPPGGSTDLLARRIAEALAKSLGR